MAARSGIWVASTMVLVVGLGTLALPGTDSSAGAGHEAITIHVPGALTLSVHCGGDHTSHADGDEVTLVPASQRCHIEAPLSPTMPLRAELQLTGARDYVCPREGVDLRCAAR